jgi:hypothetical protein
LRDSTKGNPEKIFYRYYFLYGCQHTCVVLNYVDWMFSPGHASASFSDAVIFSHPKVVDHPVYTCLVSSRPAFLKPEPYAVKLYLRPPSPTDREACTEALSAVSTGLDTSIGWCIIDG